MNETMRLILFSCLLSAALSAFSAQVYAQTTRASQQPANVVVTHRSDGAIFLNARQVQRKQALRRVLISGSRQALPALGTEAETVDPAEGGHSVARSGSLDVIGVFPIVTPELAKPKIPRTKGPNR